MTHCGYLNFGREYISGVGPLRSRSGECNITERSFRPLFKAPSVVTEMTAAAAESRWHPYEQAVTFC